MTHGGDHRHGTVGDRPHQALVAEREQVFEAPAASRHDHDVDFRLSSHDAKRVRDCGGGAWPLHIRLGDEHSRGWKAGRDRGENVALRRRVVSGDQRDSPGKAREGALALDREDALRRELPLQPVERCEVCPEPEPLDRECTQAEVAARLEELGSAEDVYSFALGEIEPQAVELAPGHADAEAASLARVLEREEDALPAILTPQLRQLALDPDGGQAPEPPGDTPVEGCDGEDLAVVVLERLDLHAVSVEAEC